MKAGRAGAPSRSRLRIFGALPARLGTWLYGSFPKFRGTFLGVPIIRTITFLGLYWGPPILGMYHIRVIGDCPYWESLREAKDARCWELEPPNPESSNPMNRPPSRLVEILRIPHSSKNKERSACKALAFSFSLLYSACCVNC